MSKYIVVHYDEIGLKGKNRGHFEKLLMKNIQKKLKEHFFDSYNEPGQIIIEIQDNSEDSVIIDILEKIPGIAYFSFATRVDADYEQIKAETVRVAKATEFKTFKIDTHRRTKNFKMNSMELNRTLGGDVLDAIDDINVKVVDPDLMIKVELTKKYAYVSVKDYKSVNGVPTQYRNKMVSLLSGGFDSPVASYLMMKRGCEIIFVHFQNSNQMEQSVENKIVQIAEQLSKFQIHTKLLVIPFADIQREIIMKVVSPKRMLIYRKIMIQIASEIAKQDKAKFLILGDSLSQVASQTIDNLEATYNNSAKPILTPLIGLDKKEIINIAKKIGTFEISKLPYGDCCSYFLPKHPELKASKRELTFIHSGLDIDEHIVNAINTAKIYEWN